MSYRRCDNCGTLAETSEEIANEPRDPGPRAPFFCKRCRKETDPTKPHADAQAIAERFNATHKPGGFVCYFPTADDVKPSVVQVRSPAWVNSAGDPVVFLSGVSGFVHVGHVTRAPTDRERIAETETLVRYRLRSKCFCGGRKARGAAFCGACYTLLPAALRSALNVAKLGRYGGGPWGAHFRKAAKQLQAAFERSRNEGRTDAG